MTVISNIHSPVLADPNQIRMTSEHLLRLIKLDRSFPLNPECRQKCIKNLIFIWKEAKKNIKSLSTIRTLCKIEVGFKKLNLFKTKIYHFYRDELKNSEEGLNDKIHLFLSDLQAVFVPPLTKTSRGMRGPTFIVAYPFEHEIMSYVIKNPDPFEMLSNRIYKAATTLFFRRDACIGFQIPLFSGFDFKKSFQENALSKRSRLTAQDSQSIQKIFRSIISVYTGHSVSTPYQIFLQEFISGENLLDFAKSKYKDLEKSQKEDLFRKFGQITILDIILGNLDRLLRITPNEDGTYELNHSFDSNLGNIMIDSSNRDVYAIDNGIETSLIKNLECKEKYLQFLATLFATPKWTRLLAENIRIALLNGLEKEFDFLSPNSKSFFANIQSDTQSFQKDLTNKELVRNSLQIGIEEMAGWLKKSFIPGWSSEREISSTIPLDPSDAQFYKAVEERLTLFGQQGNYE